MSLFGGDPIFLDICCFIPKFHLWSDGKYTNKESLTWSGVTPFGATNSARRCVFLYQLAGNDIKGLW